MIHFEPYRYPWWFKLFLALLLCFFVSLAILVLAHERRPTAPILHTCSCCDH